MPAAAGVVKYGVPLSLDDKIKVDLIVVGSVAVDPETGCRCAPAACFACWLVCGHPPPPLGFALLERLRHEADRRRVAAVWFRL